MPKAPDAVALMRAKFRITNITSYPDPSAWMKAHDGSAEGYVPTSQTLFFYPVSKSGPYPSDGSDEDNSYAKFSPSGKLELTVANPALIGKYAIDDTFYLDFFDADPKPVDAFPRTE